MATLQQNTPTLGRFDSKPSIWRPRWLVFLGYCVLITACSHKPLPPPPGPAPEQSLTEWFSDSLQQFHPDYRPQHLQDLSRIYQRLEVQPLWSAHTEQAWLRDLRPYLALETDPRQTPYLSAAAQLRQPIPADDPNLAHAHLARDLLLTDVLLTYLDDALQGRWAQDDLERDHGIINAFERWDDWPDEVVRSHLSDQMDRWLAQLDIGAPETWLMDRLQQARPNPVLYEPWLEAFLRLDPLTELDWPRLPEQGLQKGHRGPSVHQLAFQLYHLGDLADPLPYLAHLSAEAHPDASTVIFDQALQQALSQFQLRHGLPPSGRVDPATRQWLNRTPAEKQRQLAHNLRRLHHLPKTLNDRHMMVNLADQRLSFVESGNEVLNMRVVTGREGQRTPIMSQWLTSLVLNPIWNVPPNIAREQIYPRALRNPNYLASRQYQLVEGWHTPPRTLSLDDLPAQAFTRGNNHYRFIQTAGEHNELGRAKFRLSNRHAIYLHDTPNRQAFNRQSRHLSAGCVRLEDSDRLVQALLRPTPGWSRQAIEAVYAQGEERYIQVRPRVAVYLMYWTAWTDNEGRLNWRNDTYHKDRLNPGFALRPSSNR